MKCTNYMSSKPNTMTTEHDIVWASGDIQGDVFFSRAEFEQFSCQQNLYTLLINKEKELHPGGTVLLPAKGKQDVSPVEAHVAKRDVVQAVGAEKTTETPLQDKEIHPQPVVGKKRTAHAPPTRQAAPGGKDKTRVSDGVKSEHGQPKKQNRVWVEEKGVKEEAGGEKPDGSAKAKSESGEDSSKGIKKNQVWVMPEEDVEESPAPVAPGVPRAGPVRRRPFPRPSWLTREEHRIYLQLQNKYGKAAPGAKLSGPPKEVHQFKELHQKVVAEQEEFLAYTKDEAARRPHDYRYLHPEAQHFMNDYISLLCQRVTHYPQFYVQCGFVSLTDTKLVPLTHFKCLLQMGEVPRTVMPSMETMQRPRLPVDYDRITNHFPITKDYDKRPTCSFDDNAESLATKYAAEVVISASGLKCLVDPGLERQWELPVVIKEHVIHDARGRRVQKVVYIDKPFPPRTMLTAQKNAWFQKFALKTRVQHINDDHRHVFSKPTFQRKPGQDESLPESPECDLDSLETFGVSESRPSAFKKYVRPGVTQPATTKPDDTISEEKESKEPSKEGQSAENGTSGVSNGKAFSRSGSEGFIVGNPEVIETVIKDSEAGRTDQAKLKETVKGEQSDSSVSKAVKKNVANQPQSACTNEVDVVMQSAGKSDTKEEDRLDKISSERITKGNVEEVKVDVKVEGEYTSQTNDQTSTGSDKITVKKEDGDKRMKRSMATDVVKGQEPALADSVGGLKPLTEGNKNVQIKDEHSRAGEKSDGLGAQSQLPNVTHEVKITSKQPPQLTSGPDTDSESDALTIDLQDNTTSLSVRTSQDQEAVKNRGVPTEADEGVNMEEITYEEAPKIKDQISVDKDRTDSAMVDLPNKDALGIGCEEGTAGGSKPPIRAHPVRTGVRRRTRSTSRLNTDSESEALTIDLPDDSVNLSEGTSQDNTESDGAGRATEGRQTGRGRAKRGRGRPRKADMAISQDDSVNTETEEITEVTEPGPVKVKRGRGRPPKSDQRSPQAVPEPEETPAVIEHEPVRGKRGRGRPPKSDNGMPQDTTETVKTEEPTEVADPEPVRLKRGRGRGRPPKSDNDMPQEDIEAEETTEVSETDPVKAKRGRGRPAYADQDEEKSEVTVVRSGRGRPRKGATVTIPITLHKEPIAKRTTPSRAAAATPRKRQSLATPVTNSPSDGSSPTEVKRTRRTRSNTRDSLSSVDGETTDTVQPSVTDELGPSPPQPLPQVQPQPMLTGDSAQPAHPDPPSPQASVSPPPATPTSPPPPIPPDVDTTPPAPVCDDPDNVPKQVGGGPERPRKPSSDQKESDHKPEPVRIKPEPGGQKAGAGSREKQVSTLDQILQAQETFLKAPLEERQPEPENVTDMQSTSASTVGPSVKKDPLEWEPAEPASDYTLYDQDNLTYNLWVLGDIRLLIRCGIHGITRHRKRTQFVSLTPKVEYQGAYGLERTTPSETVRNWVDLFVRHVDKVTRVRVNAGLSEVMMVDQLTMGDIVNAQTGFNPLAPLGRLHDTLDKLKGLSAGHYLLSHSNGNQHATIKKNVPTSSGAYDLHKAYLEEEVGAIRDDWIPWVPIDTTVPLYHHEKEGRIPATFIPKDDPSAGNASWCGQSKRGRRKKGGKKH